MLDVDKQEHWQCPFTGVVKPNAPIDCLRKPKEEKQNETIRNKRSLSQYSSLIVRS